MTQRTKDIYGGQDPREVPTYTVAEAAHLAQLPVTTLSHWVSGQPYTAKGEPRHSPPLIHIHKGPPRLLSFSNLVEAFVLSAIRRQHGIAFPRIRRALKVVGETIGVDRPLINARFETDGELEELGRALFAIGQLKALLDAIHLPAAARAEVARVVADLMAADVLPGPDDLMTALPWELPDLRLAYVRRVPGHNAWVWYFYKEHEDALTVVAVTNVPLGSRP